MYNLDGDKVHPEWGYTADGDYRPKAAKHNVDGDIVLNDKIVTQEQLDRLRNDL